MLFFVDVMISQLLITSLQKVYYKSEQTKKYKVYIRLPQEMHFTIFANYKVIIWKLYL